MSNTIVLIGCGNMGFAMMRGWLGKDPNLDVHVVETMEALRLRAMDAGAKVVGSIADLPADVTPVLVVLAVKPGVVATVLKQSTALAERGATFVSVAAGITSSAMASDLPDGAAIIRCMPNTPAAIGEGMMALFARDGVSEKARALTAALFETSGAVTWVDDEAQLDAVTAISGSGPAYFFHFIEALIEAGTKLGLPIETATLLAKQTALGAAKLAKVSDDDPGTLREQVTSPNGTTAAALNVFMTDDRLKKLVVEATRAACDRSVELGK